MIRTKRKTKSKVKTIDYKDIIHYDRYINASNNTVTKLLDQNRSEILGITTADDLINMPDAVTNDKKVIRCLNFGLGGTTFISINGRWRFFYGSAYLKHDFNQLDLSTPKDTKKFMRGLVIPRIGNKSIMQPGDLLRIVNIGKKTGSTDIFQRSFYFGNTGVIGTDVEIDLTPAPLNTNLSQCELVEFYRMADSGGSSVIMKNLNKYTNIISLGGSSTTNLPGDSITIPNMDTNDTFFNLAYVLNNAADSFTHYNWCVELITSGP